MSSLPARPVPHGQGGHSASDTGLGASSSGRPRLRDLGLGVGVMRPGLLNAITDVAGVRVGHCTVHDAQRGIHTGVTAIIPHPGNIFQEKVPGAVYVGNGFGKLIGSTQINELGTIETPILLTNTLSVWTAAEALVRHLLRLPGNEKVRSINPVVGETNDGALNDIRGQHIRPEHVLAALQNAREGPVAEGSVGAGAGTICFGFKGGIGTSSRLVTSRAAADQPTYTVGVLVQTNYGGILEIAGIPVGKELQAAELQRRYGGLPVPPARAIRPRPGPRPLAGQAGPGGQDDGSCMIVVATDAPLTHASLMRLAKRAMLAIGRTGSSSSHGSGDYVIAFSTSEKVRLPPRRDEQPQPTSVYEEVNAQVLSLLFQAAMEATEEAIYNSLLQATSVTGADGRTVEALPLDQLRLLIKKYRP